MGIKGRPRKPKEKLVDVPTQFEKDDEHGLTEMQSSFVWHYTEGARQKQHERLASSSQHKLPTSS